MENSGLVVMFVIVILFFMSSLFLEVLQPIIEEKTKKPLKLNKMTTLAFTFFLGGIFNLIASVLGINGAGFNLTLFAFVLFSGAYLFYIISQNIKQK